MTVGGMKCNAEERILNAGYEDVVYLVNYSYDDALIGISEDNRAIYDYNKMVEWFIREESFTEEEAVDWISYNTIRALSYMGDKAPIIMYPIEWGKTDMTKLIGYAMASANKNAIDNGHLVKAMCEFCGRKFSSIEDARKCETKHINDAIIKNLNK